MNVGLYCPFQCKRGLWRLPLIQQQKHCIEWLQPILSFFVFKHNLFAVKDAIISVVCNWHLNTLFYMFNCNTVLVIDYRFRCMDNIMSCIDVFCYIHVCSIVLVCCTYFVNKLWNAFVRFCSWCSHGVLYIILYLHTFLKHLNVRYCLYNMLTFIGTRSTYTYRCMFYYYDFKVFHQYLQRNYKTYLLCLFVICRSHVSKQSR